MGNVQARSNDLVAGRAALERALVLAQERDDPVLAAEASAYLANVCAWMGEFERSRAVSLMRVDLARRTQDPFELRDVYEWLGLNDLLQGRWTDAEHWFAEQEPIIEDLQSPEPRASLHGDRGILCYLRGRFVEAEQEFRVMVEALPSGSGALLWYLGWLGHVLAEMGQREEALACYAQLHTQANALDPQARGRSNAFTHLAIGYARLGLRDHAADCYEQLLPFQGQVSPVLINRGSPPPASLAMM
jgi:tetratricopeptide (TPR) repeat protein